eukprot:gene17011-biopygen6808
MPCVYSRHVPHENTDHASWIHACLADPASPPMRVWPIQLVPPPPPPGWLPPLMILGQALQSYQPSASVVGAVLPRAHARIWEVRVRVATTPEFVTPSIGESCLNQAGGGPPWLGGGTNPEKPEQSGNSGHFRNKRNSTEQYSRAPCCTEQHGTVRNSTEQPGTAVTARTVRNSTEQHGTARNSTEQHGTARNRTEQYRTVRRRGNPLHRTESHRAARSANEKQQLIFARSKGCGGGG